MKRVILVAAILLAGCADTPGERAEKAYEVASGAIIDGPNKKCQAARDAAQAFAEEGNSEKYSRWELTAYNDCTQAKYGPY